MGWNGSSAATSAATNKKVAKPRKVSSGAPMSGAFKGTLAFILVLAIGAGAYFFVADDVKVLVFNDKEYETKEIAEAKPEFRHVEYKSKVRSDNVVQDLLEDASVATANVEVVKSIYELRPDIDWDAMTNRTFSTGTEQLLSWICHTTPGDFAMPLPPLPEEEKKNMAAILISKNEIKDTDDDKTVEAKETVDFAKKELTQFIKEGGDPDDFFEYYDKAIKDAFARRNAIIEELQAMQSDEEGSEDPEVMRELVKKVNDALDQEGIKPVTFNEDTNSIY